MQGCVFCHIWKGIAPADIVHRGPHMMAIVPLNPVVKGHLIVIPKTHVQDALVRPAVTAGAMWFASEHAKGSCNLITSVGGAATQSIRHLHVHIVPRKYNDGLMLPWGDNEDHYRTEMENALLFYSGG